jgi:AraC-like DNA-binding protein
LPINVENHGFAIASVPTQGRPESPIMESFATTASASVQSHLRGLKGRSRDVGAVADLCSRRIDRADTVVFEPSERRSFVAILQSRGSSTLSHGGESTAVDAGDVVLIIPQSRVVWRPLSPDSRGVVISGGPALSLRFRPRSSANVKLGTDNVLAPLLKDCFEKTPALLSASDPRTAQKLAEVVSELIDIAIFETESPSARKLLGKLARCEPNLDDPEFDPLALAAGCGVTLRTLQKRLRGLNTSPRQWILQRRLERIRTKLNDPLLANLTVRQIAFRSGFRDYSYFIRSFKDAFAVTPGRYRR